MEEPWNEHFDLNEILFTITHKHTQVAYMDGSSKTEFNDFVAELEVKRQSSSDDYSEEMRVPCRYCEDLKMHVKSSPFLFSAIRDLNSSNKEDKAKLAVCLEGYWNFGLIIGGWLIFLTFFYCLLAILFDPIGFLIPVLILSIIFIPCWWGFVKISVNKYKNKDKFNKPILCSLSYRKKKKLNIKFSEAFNLVTFVSFVNDGISEKHYICLRQDIPAWRWAKDVYVLERIEEFLSKRNVLILGLNEYRRPV